MKEIIELFVNQINVGKRIRGVDKSRVKELAKSIGDNRMLHPIEVTKFGDEYWLTAGNHRLEAHKYLGKDLILATVTEGNLDDPSRLITEIDETYLEMS